MKKNIIIGLFLIVLGALFTAYQFFPGLKSSLQGMFTWPLIIVAFGLFLLIKNLVDKDGDGLVTACVILGVGGVLYLQESSQVWSGWYNWLLMPGFAGAGHLLAAMTGQRKERHMERGVWLILLSAVLYALFSPLLNLSLQLQQYWPLLLIAAGVALIFKAMRKK